MPATKEQSTEGWVSVTQVLDYFIEPSLCDWKVDTGRKESNRISKLTAKTGTRVHELIGKDWRDGSYKLAKADNSEVRSCMEAWVRFKEDYKPRIISMEYEMRNENRGIVGHIDMLVDIGQNKLILDIKTAGSIRQKHWLQLDGYAWLQPEFDGKIAILRLDRNIGVYEYEERGVEQPSLFVQALNLYDFYLQRAYSPKEIGNASNTTHQEVRN